MNIILYLLQIIQYQYKVIGQLLNFICRYIPLKQHAFDDSHSPKYQKFKDCSCPRCKAPIMSFCLTFRVNLGANYDLALWVAYYNFLRPHKHNHFKVLNEVEMLKGADNMPGKWQLLIFLGQQTILQMQKNQAASSNCS